MSLKKKGATGGEYQSDNMDVIHAKFYDEWQKKRTVFMKPPTDIMVAYNGP